MKILGIDPGIGRMGWGVVEMQSAKCKVQNYGCLETSANQSLEKRIEELYHGLLTILEIEKPDAMSIEELFFNTNAKTALIVGQARGIVLLVAALKQIPLISYTPLQVKLAVTGYGRAEKRQIGEMVKILLKLPTIPKPDDTADALAIALTHAFSRKMTSK